jgi:cysteinyl-tRNA synthetase
VIQFWQDKWCWDATIDFVLMRSDAGGACEWNVTNVRGFNDWEIEVVVEIFQFLNSHQEIHRNNILK